MIRASVSVLAPIACLLLVACPADSEETAIEGWQGDEPHFAVKGFLNGEDLDFSIDGDDTGASVWCEREYLVPLVDGEPDLSQARQSETTVAGFVTIDGQERAFEFELLSHSLQDDEPGAELSIVPRVDGVDPESDELWIEWEWATPDGETLFEAAAQEGTLVREQFSGTPGEGGVIIPDGEGFIGGYLQARWSVDESLTISFSVACTEHEIEEY